MCWVIPPASPAATWVWRIASSSEVLPWSTWPITVTTGGRSTRSSSSSSSTTGLLDLLLGGGDDLDLAVELLGDRLDRLVGERLGEGRHLTLLHQSLDHLGGGEAEALGDLADGGAGVDLDRRLLLGLLQLPVAGLLEQRAAAAAAAAARRAGRRLGLGDVVAAGRL